ncbi:MAG: hypothetical protein AMXMBFR84_06590 [Candidatus Hydrogenedentota bacterium]
MSDTVTQSIRVITESFYVPDRSNPSEHRFFFAYRIQIINEGDEPAKLVRRHWVITDALGEEKEVKGEGVVGEQPYIEPGRHFEYMSACPLHTSYGTMEGAYTMRRDDGAEFEVDIGAFELLFPHALN